MYIYTMMDFPLTQYDRRDLNFRTKLLSYWTTKQWQTTSTWLFSNNQGSFGDMDKAIKDLDKAIDLATKIG